MILKRLVLCLSLASLASATGCYRYTFRTGATPAPDKKVTEWRHIGLWGHIEPKPFDLEQACPEGVAEFGSYVSPANWPCALLTAGLYTPRTVYAIPVETEEAPQGGAR